MNKKGFEEEGMHFSTKNIALIILFLVVLAIAIALILPRLNQKTSGNTLYNFGSSLFETLTAGNG